ncbi:MOB kinase activator-like 1A protein [Tanacetum coccineum]
MAEIKSVNAQEALIGGVNAQEALNAVDFFNQVNLLYGTLTEFCTPEICPTMTAGPKYEYRDCAGFCTYQ